MADQIKIRLPGLNGRQFASQKKKGGLGIKDINTFNLALLDKWKWNLFQHEGQLMARVLESKYGGWRNLDEAPHDSNESIWWSDLKMVFQNSKQNDDVQNSIVLRVGCGDRIKFWEDKWTDGEVSLLAKYPRMYLISCQQNQLIQQMGAIRNQGGVEFFMEEAIVRQ